MIGETLSAYKIESELGSGGMGKVYLAELARKAAGLDEGKRVALKVIHANLLEQDGFFKRFLREADVGKSVQHENVVRTYDCDAVMSAGIQQNFLVMEYVEGQTLRDLLKELQRVPEELCRHIAREVASGLRAIHEAGVVHRDIKPENVLITEEHVVKIMDLGVARLQDEAIRLSQAGAFVGSLEYAAPEQFVGAGEEPDGRADLHALGLVLYELSTGQHPYRDEDARKVLRNILDAKPRRAGEVNPQLSPFFEELIHTLIAKDRDDRVATAAELSEILEACEQGEWWKERAKALRLETKQPLRRIRVPRETALYGRDDDLAKLHALFEKAKAGEGQVLLVEGEAGIGKTRLVDEFVGKLRQEGEDINFLFGSYPPGGAATTSGAFSKAYREQFGEADLEEALEQYLQPTPILIPAFAALLRGESTPTGAEALTKDSLQTVFVHATRGLAAERPTLVLIDDLHFAPEDGQALFAALALAVQGHRIVLVGTARQGLSEEWTSNLERQEHASRISLHRLGPKDLLKLLQDSFRSERLAHELAGQVALKSDGNPFFAFEIIRGLREGQFITQQADGTWVSTQVIKDIQIPSSVMDLVQARLRDLSEEEREFLDVASCFGFGFDPELVAEVVGVKLIPALRALGRIETRHRLVRSAGEDFEFDHHQVQETLYSSLPVRLARAYHAGIADALEEREGAAAKEPDALDGAMALELCNQFLQGGKAERALRYLDAGLSHLEGSYLHDQAVALIERVLDEPSPLQGSERAEILLRLDRSLASLGRRDHQRACLDEATALAEASGDQDLLLRARISQSDLLHAFSEYEDAAAESEAAIELALASGDRLGEAKARLTLSNPLSSLSRYEEARVQAERALELATELGAREEEARANGRLAWAFYRLGRPEESIAFAERQLEIASGIGDLRIEATALGTLGTAYSMLGRFEDEEARCTGAMEAYRQVGDRAGEATCLGNLGTNFTARGQYHEACELAEQAMSLWREMGDRKGLAIARYNLAGDIGRLGAREQARGLYLEALEAAREIKYAHFASATITSLSKLAMDDGDLEAASRLIDEALTLFEELGLRDPYAASAHRVRARLASLRGEDQDASSHLQVALEIADEAGAADSRVLALGQLAALGHRDGTDAVEALQRDVKCLTHGARMEASYVLFQATGDKQHLDAAHFLLTQAIEHAPDEYKESMVEYVPLHREIMKAWKEHSA